MMSRLTVKQSTTSPLKFAVQSLKDGDVISKSFTASKDSQVSLSRSYLTMFVDVADYQKPLSTQEEILANVYWRFLQLRGYIDEKNQLTPWGVCLEQALSVLDPSGNLEEATLLAIEMARFGLLNSRQWFSHVSGGPMRGSGKISRLRVPSSHHLTLTLSLPYR